MKDYIKIEPDFTLDKGVDNSSPTARPNSFTSLTNYIPEQGCVSTRRGIDEFNFVADYFDPTEDPACVMWLRFENGALTTDTINGAGLFSQSGSGSADTSTYKEGAASYYSAYGVNSNYLYATNAAIQAAQPTFPCTSGGNEDFLITGWIKPDWLGDGIQFIRKDPYGAVGGLALAATGSSPYYWVFIVAEEGGSFFRIESLVAVTKVWWHFGIWHSSALGLTGLRLYNASGDTISNYTSSTGGGVIGKSDTDNFSLGYNLFRGWMDDFIVFDDCPETTGEIYNKIDTIRSRS